MLCVIDRSEFMLKIKNQVNKIIAGRASFRSRRSKRFFAMVLGENEERAVQFGSA